MYEIYNVKRGDTIENLARNLGITPEILATINGLDITATLTPNTSIIIPSNNTFFNKYIIKKGAITIPINIKIFFTIITFFYYILISSKKKGL